MILKIKLYRLKIKKAPITKNLVLSKILIQKNIFKSCILDLQYTLINFQNLAKFFKKCDVKKPQLLNQLSGKNTLKFQSWRGTEGAQHPVLKSQCRKI
ncbi:hypothetical protein BpHYR1_047700 [Brachionus plicatilis]|uniref:Uncharacterized protein n=1 Tax=Brachionus plicatilis TaxID=10195 RepID=A0A3M7RY37_BRAPC|nr:hypothetical protein BpHYR1_047700 [Brachionus plicatilis]